MIRVVDTAEAASHLVVRDVRLAVATHLRAVVVQNIAGVVHPAVVRKLLVPWHHVSAVLPGKVAALALEARCVPDQLRQRLRLAHARNSSEVLGRALGQMLAGIAAATDVSRLVVTGGDTSGFAAQAMEIETLSFAGRLAPGGPLCTVVRRNPAIDDRQIVFKGGQVGRVDFFARVLSGQPVDGPQVGGAARRSPAVATRT